MNTVANASPASEPGWAESGYELRFDSMFVEGRGLAFPCDAAGRVNLDRLSERARANYLYARAVVGREYRFPAVRHDARRDPCSPGRH